MYAVYRISNKLNTMSYIGITGQPVKRRWRVHVSASRCEQRRSYVQNAIRVHGADSFNFEHLCTVPSVTEAIELERLLIADLGTLAPAGYNLTAGGEVRKEVSAETRRRLSLAHRGIKQSAETIERRRVSMLGKPQTAQKSERIRAAKLGVKRSPEFCEKMRQLRRGRELPESAKQKLRLFWTGRKRKTEQYMQGNG